MTGKKINYRFFIHTFWISLFLWCVFIYNTSAQKASAQLTPSSFLIGDRTTLMLQLELQTPKSVLWPAFIDSTTTHKFDVIERGSIDTLKSDSSKKFTLSQKIIFTSFDSGTVVLPPFIFYSNDSSFIATTDSLKFVVNTVAVDTTKVFKDIHEPLEEYLRFSELLPWILLVLALILVFGFGIYIYYRQKKKKPLFTIFKAKTMTANEFAVSALLALRDKRLWQNGLVKEYYTELTDILRLYISQRFQIDALEMLSNQIVDDLSIKPDQVANLSALKELLTVADLVKFAKQMPLPNENDRFLESALEFVRMNKPIDLEAKEKKPEVDG